MNEQEKAAKIERIKAKIKALAKTENEREQIAYVLYLLTRLNFIDELKADQTAGELQRDPEQEARAKPEQSPRKEKKK